MSEPRAPYITASDLAAARRPCYHKHRHQDLMMHDGAWCIRCECGAFVPVETEEDVCPICFRTYRLLVRVQEPS